MTRQTSYSYWDFSSDALTTPEFFHHLCCLLNYMDTILQQLSPRVSKAEQIGSPNWEREVQPTCPGARQCSVFQPDKFIYKFPMHLCWERSRPAECEQAAHSPLGLGNDGPKGECRGESEGTPPWTTESCAWRQSGDHSQIQAYSEKAKKAKAQRSNGHVCAQSCQSCPTLCGLMDRSLPGSSVPRTLQARLLEWVAIPFSRGSS